jgi:hypothetical protein
VAKSSTPKTAKETKSTPVVKSGSRGFGFLSLCIAFLIGLISIPVYYYMSYDIVTKQDHSIVLTPKRTLPVKTGADTENISATKTAEAPRSHEETCARNRWIIKKAMLDYQKKYPVKNGKLPTIFDLLGKKYLKEFPNCPDGGAYTIKMSNEQPEVECSKHGMTH